MRTALIESLAQGRLFEENERGWRDDGKEVDAWKEEVSEWERTPKKWLSGETNPYRPRVKSAYLFLRISLNTDALQPSQWRRYRFCLPKKTMLS
jgi:hypothetical protein